MPGTVKENYLTRKSGQTISSSLTSHTQAGKTVAILLRNPSWHLEQGGGAQESSEISVQQGGAGRWDEKPRGAPQNNYKQKEAKLPSHFFLMILL